MRPVVAKLAAVGMALAMLALQATSEGHAVEHRGASDLGLFFTLAAMVAIALFLALHFVKPYFRQWGIPLPLSPASLDNYKADVGQEAHNGLANKATVLED